EIANGFRQMFCCSPLMTIMAMDDTPFEFYSMLAKGFLDLKGSRSEMLEWARTCEFEGVADAWTGVGKFCEAILHILNERSVDPEGKLVFLPASSVFHFTQFNGARHFERTIRAAFARAGWWGQQVQEVTRHAGSRALVQPKMETFLATLPEDSNPASISTARLQEIFDLFEDIQKSVRSLELEPLKEKLCELVSGCARSLLDATDGIDNARVSLVFRMLAIDAVALQPGMESLSRDFKEWASLTKDSRSLADCTRLMAASARTDLDFQAVQKSLPEENALKNANEEAISQFHSGLATFLAKGIPAAMDK
ncbi:unnamed protein product, partial [Symbiodinium sp. CCMP2592]